MKKILVVEDDNFLLNAYRVKLTKSGFELKNALNGEEALTALSSFMPDLIILDLVMPVMDGFECLQKLRSDPKWKNIPVLITSNLGQEEDIKRGRELGATDYIIKSDTSLDAIIQKINSMLA